jgi:hypothetical protein
VALTLGPFCAVFFLWFMGSAVAYRGGRGPILFDDVLGTGQHSVALMFATTALMAGLLTLAGEHDGHLPINVWQLGRSATFTLSTSYAMRRAAVFMTPASTIALRLRIHAKVIAWIGYAAAVLLLIAPATVPWIELVFALWVLLVSVALVAQSYRSARLPVFHSIKARARRRVSPTESGAA